MNTCACGCGQTLTNPKSKYIKGHNFNIRTLQDRTCEHCGRTFHPLIDTQKYCSIECFSPHRSEGRRKRTTKVCEVCGKTFEVRAYRGDAKWCSKECWNNRRKPFIKTCDTCGKQFDAKDHRARFCSHECLLEWKTGDTSPVWKGGVAAHRRRSKYKGDLAKWRKAVFQRDDYACQHCGKKGDIHAHHVKPLAEFPDLALDVDNGLTLCVTCHEAVHGRKLSTPAKYPKHCVECGESTTGRSKLCRACAIRQYHANIGHNQTKTCPQCGTQFKGKREQVFCSVSCGVKARHARSKSTG